MLHNYINKLLIGILTCMLLTGCEEKETILLQQVDESVESTPKETNQEPLQADEEDLLEMNNNQMYVIHVCGAVKNPGVYELKEGSRVFEAIDLAGGFTEEAGQEYLNLAGKLKDGSKLYIPTKEEVSQAKIEGNVEDTIINMSEEEGNESSSADMKINLNTATEEQLTTLPGIGSGKAKSIIAYRQKHGEFQKLEDIMQVDGIKEGSFDKLKDFITI